MRVLLIALFMLLVPIGVSAKNISVSIEGAALTSGVPYEISSSPNAGSQATTLVFTISNPDDTGTNLNISSLGVVWGINTEFDSIKVDGVEISGTPSSNVYSIAPLGSVELSVTYTPTAVGQFGAMIDITSNADNISQFSLQFAGYAMSNPEIDIVHEGSSVAVGGTSAITTSPVPGVPYSEVVTVQNLGTSTLNIDYLAENSLTTTNADVLGVAVAKSTLLAGETAELSITYVATTSGAFSLGVLIHSDDADEDFYNFTLTGTASNRTPQADAGPDQLVSSGVDVSLDASASVDPDGDLLDYVWVVLSDPTGLVTLNDNTAARPAFTAPQVWNTQEIVFRLTTSDGLAQSTDEVSIFVAPGVGAELEVFDAIGNPRASGSTISISSASYTNTPETQTITLVNNGSASLVLTNTTASALNNVAVISVIPSAASIAPAGLIFMNISFVPLAPGDFSFDLTLSSNDADEGSYVLSFSGTASNRAPIANAGSDVSTQSGETIILRATDSSDPDGTSLTYLWEQLSGPSVTITNATSEVAEFIAPVVDTTTELIFRVSVADLIDSSVDDVIVTVSPEPLPEIEILSDTNAAILDGATLNIEPNPESDGTPAQEVLTIKNTGTAILSLNSLLVQDLSNVTVSDLAFASSSVMPGEATALTITYTVNAKGAFFIDLDIISNDNDEATYDIILQGVGDNQTPVADAGADQSVVEGQIVNLSARASTDPDGDGLAYSWSQVSGPTVTLNSPTSQSASFTAPSVFDTTNLTFRVTVTDGISVASDDVVVAVYVSTARSHLATAKAFSSIINKKMLSNSTGIVAGRTRDRLTAASFNALQTSGAIASNFDQIDTFFEQPDQLSGNDGWIHVSSDDLLLGIKQQRERQIDESLNAIGSDYALSIDPIDSFIGSRTTGLDTYSSFGIGRYTNKDGAAYDGIGGYIALGADYLFDDTLLIGASFTAESNELAFENEQDGSLRKSGSHLNVYGAFYLDDIFYLETMLGTGGYVNHIEANYSKGETNSRRVDASAKAGMNFDLRPIAASPWGQFAYSREVFDAYITSDNTVVDNFEINASSGAFGLDLRSSQPLWGVLQPYATLGLDIDLSSANDGFLSSGVSFEPRTLEGSLTWGARFDMRSSTDSHFYADVSMDKQGDFQSASSTDLNFKIGISW